MNNIEIAKAYIKSIQTGDQAAFGGLCAPDIIWHQPGENKFSGTKNGMAELGTMLGGMMQTSGGTFAITKANGYLANGEMVAVEIEFAGKNGDKILSQVGIDLLRIDGGKIVEVWLFSSNPEQEDAFWGK